jgi:hypothetical protein
MTMDYTAEHNEAWLEADFGMDPHILPQFELLVAEGKITQEYADQVIAARRELGFAMSPGELKPRPLPLVTALTWVSKFGGPEIRALTKEGLVEIEGREWSWYDRQYNPNLTLHLRAANGEHLGWIHLSLHASNAGGSEAILWARTHIVSRSPNPDKNAREVFETWGATGIANSVSQAIADATNWDFDPQIVAPGITLVRTGDQKWNAVGAVEIEVTHTPWHAEANWKWSCRSELLKPIFEVTSGYELSGFQATRQLAVAMAVTAIQRLSVACRIFVANLEGSPESGTRS